MALAWKIDMLDYHQKIKFYEKNCNGVNLYWIDGNHENFDIIKKWNRTRDKIYDNSAHIHYLPRGYQGKIKDKTFLCMGGADSIDRNFRINHYSWWEQEQITDEDIDGISGHFDYVFTHCCPYSVFKSNSIYLIQTPGSNQIKTDHTSEQKLDKMINNITFEHYYFGHYHTNKKLNNKYTCLYQDFIELE